MNGRLQKWRAQFTFLWSGQAVSLLTSSILQMAIVWHLTEQTGSAAVLSLATLIGYLPAAVLGLFIGSFVDRHSRKKVMVVADLFIASLGIMLAISSMHGSIPLWLIMLVLLLRSFGTAFHYPALQSVTPSIVPQEHLTQYAGYAQSFESFSMVLSPAIAALLYSAWGLTTIIVMDVIGAFVAVGMLLFVNIPPAQSSAKTQQSLLRDTVDGFRAVRQIPGMVWLMTIGALYAILYFPIGTLFPFIAMNYFGGGVWESGLVEVIFSVGSLLGSLALGLFGGKIAKIPAMAASIGFYGVGVLATGLLPPSGLAFFVGFSVLMGLSVPFYTGIQTAIFQMKFPQLYLGRVFSLSSSLSTFAMPVGLLLAGTFTDLIGVNILFVIAGILALLLAMMTSTMPSLKNCCMSKADVVKEDFS